MANKTKGKTKKVAKKRVSTSLISECVECSPIMVRKVQNGERSADTELGQKIEVAEMLLEEGLSGLVTNVKKAISI